MHVVFAILLIAAAVCFGVSAFLVPTRTRVNFVALGLLFWVLVFVIKTLA